MNPPIQGLRTVSPLGWAKINCANELTNLAIFSINGLRLPLFGVLFPENRISKKIRSILFSLCRIHHLVFHDSGHSFVQKHF